MVLIMDTSIENKRYIYIYVGSFILELFDGARKIFLALITVCGMHLINIPVSCLSFFSFVYNKSNHSGFR